MTLATLLSWWSGLALVAPQLPLPTLLGTMLVLHVCDAIMCRLLARNSGYPALAWTALGFAGGLWAVIALLLLPRRTAAPASQP